MNQKTANLETKAQEFLNKEWKPEISVGDVAPLGDGDPFDYLIYVHTVIPDAELTLLDSEFIWSMYYVPCLLRIAKEVEALGMTRVPDTLSPTEEAREWVCIRRDGEIPLLIEYKWVKEGLDVTFSTHCRNIEGLNE
jgi:hypothetical protein